MGVSVLFTKRAEKSLCMAYMKRAYGLLSIQTEAYVDNTKAISGSKLIIFCGELLLVHKFFRRRFLSGGNLLSFIEENKNSLHERTLSVSERK